MAWSTINGQKGKAYALATESGKNKHGSPIIFAHLVHTEVTFDNLSGTFVIGDTITGGTSGATALVRLVESSYLLVSDVASGPFQNDEQITGSESGATADVNGAPVDGESKVVSVQTATLGQATVFVEDDGADESFVDSEMANYAT